MGKKNRRRSSVAPTLTRKRTPDDFPPGTIGIISGILARFSEFTVSILNLTKPPGCRITWAQGVNLTTNYNALIDQLEGEWLWLMGDDHVFHPDILIGLLERDVDVVVPLCLKKFAPFEPVVYGHESGPDENGHMLFHEADLPESGMIEIHAAGSAGMLIRRPVLEALAALDRPIFETTDGIQNEDLILCQKIREAGFKIHCDVDQKLGHIGIFGVWPLWQGDGFGTLLGLGGGQVTPLWRIRSQEDVMAMTEDGLARLAQEE